MLTLLIEMLASSNLESVLDHTIHSHCNTEILIMSLVLNSVINVSKISSVLIYFFCKALEECLKSHLGNDVITSRNELTSQVKIRGSYKDEVFTLLKRLGFQEFHIKEKYFFEILEKSIKLLWMWIAGKICWCDMPLKLTAIMDVKMFRHSSR